MKLSREDLDQIRDALRANMHDGDEGGTLTMGVKDMLDETIEIIDIAMNGDAAFAYERDMPSLYWPAGGAIS